MTLLRPLMHSKYCNKRYFLNKSLFYLKLLAYSVHTLLHMPLSKLQTNLSRIST